MTKRKFPIIHRLAAWSYAGAVRRIAEVNPNPKRLKIVTQLIEL
jgi:hypothetical protein